MTQQHTITARTSWHSRLLGGSQVHEVRLTNGALIITGPDKRATERIPATVVSEARIEEGLLHNGLTVTTLDGRTITAGGLPREESKQIRRALGRHIQQNLDREATQQARALTPRITGLDSQIQQMLSPERYTRHSETTGFAEEAKGLVEQCDGRTGAKLDPAAKGALERLRNAANPQKIGKDRRSSNEEFVARVESMVQAAAGDILPNGLTTEQARAIATEDDATLVLAGAGTGKTAVIIGKIAHLVRNQGVDPSAVLALTFNQKAAGEISERLPEDLKGATVSTFHAFGRRVIAAAGTAPTISRMASDDFALAQAMDLILDQMLRDPAFAGRILGLISSMPAEYRSPFDFENAAEYQQYVKDVELRTLSGDLVKSFEELTIANFLTENGVEFRYEAPYPVNTASSRYRQYQPDFHLPDQDIHIEHFALDKNGNPPREWTGYAEGVAWKREVHQDHGTTLIETYSWQRRDGTLLQTLRAGLEELGVEFHAVPVEEMVKRLSGEQVRWLAHLMRDFLNHAKSGDLSREELDRRSRNARDPGRTEVFLGVFHQLRERYEEMLAEEGAIDFHDLINRAADIIRNGAWESPFEHVLVDEFQDISSGRMALLEALGKDGPAYFMVGDDWQSINRFAGSNVGLLLDCDRHLGHTERRVLTRTFRFGKGILEPSGRFIQRNPEQTRRQLTTERNGEGVVVMANPDQREGLEEAVREVLERSAGGSPRILVLGRYRRQAELVKQLQGRVPARLDFSTVHSAKGREAEHIIVLGLEDGRYGFPCMVDDDPLLELALPPVHGKAFPHAEERRLFYVALTRAVKAVYLVTDPARPSLFVRELLAESPEVEERGELAASCPACPRGSLLPYNSRENLRCSNYPGCGYLAPRCPGCRQGYVAVTEGQERCSNPGCRETPAVCPACREGILVRREGRRGPFWGCTRYRAEPSCRYTQPGEPAGPARHPGSPPENSRRGVLG